MKIVEYLFYDYSTLYADMANIKYLEKCNSNIKIVLTPNTSKPYFLSNKVDMIYIGSMTERCQEKMIEKLLPYKDVLKKLIEENVIFYASGNSFEIFGKYILDEDKTITCLNIFDFYSKRYMHNRHNSHFLGLFKDMKIVGFRSQFSFTYNNKYPFIKKINGIGFNETDDNEGILYNNFFGTYILGPFFILNPYFIKYLLKLLNLDDALIYEKEIINAYDYRLKELEKDSLNYRIGEHG